MSEHPDAQDRRADAPGKIDESRDELRALAEQQAALRRVAILVARGVAPSEVFSAVVEEMRNCLRVDNAAIMRFENDGTVTFLSGRYQAGVPMTPVGERWPLDGESIAAMVLATGQPARIDDHEQCTGTIARRTRELGLRCRVGAPIVVAGRIWGVAVVASAARESLPRDTEACLRDYADLVATAIDNAATRDALQASRDNLSVLAEQQAALRRVATLVARGVSPHEVFAAVAEEMRRCLHTITSGLWRYEPTGEVTLIASAAKESAVQAKWPVGTRTPIEGNTLASAVLRTGRAARMDTYEDAPGLVGARVRESGVRAAVGVPVIVCGSVWGLAAVGSVEPRPLPADTEARLGEFAELLCTALANADTRDELREVVEQQAALRRVATLVARGVSPATVFAVVAEEIARCLDVPNAEVFRFEDNGAVIVGVGCCAAPGLPVPSVGERITTEGDNISARLFRTGQAVRMDNYAVAVGTLAERVRAMGMRSAVGVPIVVGERVWGEAIVGSTQAYPVPPDTEERLADFADLAATAIANAATRDDLIATRDELIATRDELIASRARIVVAADDARRRLERDLHDGAQQRLVSLGLQARMAEAAVPAALDVLRSQLSDLASGLSAVSKELQEISRGIHPAILSDGGLGPALKTLARRSPIPANIDVLVEGRLPESVEVAAYYVVAEALTNAAKYSQATNVKVFAEIKEGKLCLSVQDNGIGGADSRNGSGLIGLKDRVEVVGGHMNVISPPKIGTSLHVTIPLTR